MKKVLNKKADCSKCIHFELEGIEAVCNHFNFVIEDEEPLCTAFEPEEKEFDKEEFIKFINQNVECDSNCPCHKFFTHNTCITCKALKNSPYHQDFLKDKTDEEIAEAVQEAIEEFC